MRVSLRLAVAAAALASAAHLYAADGWQTATELSGVDLTGLTAVTRPAALKMIREQDCNCGCQLKIAECRVKDPQCSYSKGLANAVAEQFRAGKDNDAVFATLRELQKQGPVRPKLLEDPVALDVKGAPSKGPANAKITIVEFSDFQCPYCAMAAPKALAVLAEYPRDVRIVFKQFPLEIHSKAYLAAEASLAAHSQGKFWPFHDKLFASFREISRENLSKWAAQAGLDVKAFDADLASGRFKPVVDRDTKDGFAAGVMGTPTFFINGKRYNGPFDMQALRPVLEAELKGQTAAAVR